MGSVRGRIGSRAPPLVSTAVNSARRTPSHSRLAPRARDVHGTSAPNGETDHAASASAEPLVATIPVPFQPAELPGAVDRSEPSTARDRGSVNRAGRVGPRVHGHRHRHRHLARSPDPSPRVQHLVTECAVPSSTLKPVDPWKGIHAVAWPRCPRVHVPGNVRIRRGSAQRHSPGVIRYPMPGRVLSITPLDPRILLRRRLMYTCRYWDSSP